MKSFARSLVTVSGLTIVSRVGGFLRDTLTAMFLGAGPVADAFFVAQRLPNLFRSLFAEGAFSAAFVPLYTTEQERHGRDAAQAFAGQALALLLAALIPFSAVIMWFMPQVMLLLAPGFENDPQKYNLAVSYSTITFPYLALISITALQTGVLNAQGRFGPGAAAPIAFNIVLIIAMFLARLFAWPVGTALAWAVTASGVVQMVWLMVSCHRAGVSLPLVWPHWGEASKRLFRRIGPGALGAGAAQVNLLISTILASTLPTGAVSYLFYADRLNQLPLGVVGIAVATTLLPVLSRHIEGGREEEAHYYMSRSVEFCLLLGLPATLGLALAAVPIIQTLFEHGVFTHEDSLATAATLAAYALGIPAFLLVKVFAAGFFARHDTSTPVRVAIIAMVVNVVASILFLGLFKQVGIALANSLAVSVNAVLLYLRLRKKIGPFGDARLRQSVLRLGLSAAGMAALIVLLVLVLQPRFQPHHLAANIAWLCLLIGVALVGYAGLLLATRALVWRDVLALLRRETKIGAIDQ
ncbi:MAG: murein biosynthesis integral membrane protein MurJ [Alphaproteobacteria bacterium]|nr:murein biosynthesis integral membrane protein MurJ [Alphaproteobacteria bacterium]MBV8548830.1 murein biosynthesis integral membrane protein MurJ [Alphaproteobacteria bacterium]